jgi:integrase
VGDRSYKPSVIHGYEVALTDRIYPEFGRYKPADLDRADVQRFADQLHAKGASPSTVRNVLLPLRLVYRRDLRDGVVAVNPTAGVELDPVSGRRERAADPAGRPL